MECDRAAPGQYDQAYLDRIKSVVELCAQGGIQVLVDFHQDAYSKEIGEDGAPLWAITPAPIDPNKGGSLNLLPLRLSTQTNEAFASFWRNEQVTGKGLQDHYIAAITHVAEAVNGTPAVIGVDLFNEPWLLHAQSLLTAQGKNPQLNLDMLYAFYAKAIPAVRAALPNKLIMFEPDVAKNDPASIPPGSTSQPPYTATVPRAGAMAVGGHGLRPALLHQELLLPGDAAAGCPNVRPDDPDITANLNNSMAEAKAFGSPLLLGEFGFTPKAAQYQATINAIYAQTNKNAISTAQWLWKEESQDSWGFFDYSTGTPVLRSEAAAATAQPYPQAVSGKLTSAAFDQGSQTLTVNFVYADTKGPNLIFVPTEYGFKGGYEVKCGQDVVQTVAELARRLAQRRVREGRRKGLHADRPADVVAHALGELPLLDQHTDLQRLEFVLRPGLFGVLAVECGRPVGPANPDDGQRSAGVFVLPRGQVVDVAVDDGPAVRRGAVRLDLGHRVAVGANTA